MENPFMRVSVPFEGYVHIQEYAGMRDILPAQYLDDAVNVGLQITDAYLANTIDEIPTVLIYSRNGEIIEEQSVRPGLRNPSSMVQPNMAVLDPFVGETRTLLLDGEYTEEIIAKADVLGVSPEDFIVWSLTIAHRIDRFTREGGSVFVRDVDGDLMLSSTEMI